MLKYALKLNNYKNRDTSETPHEEYQYLNLLQDILNNGSIEEGRNGFTKCDFGSAMRFTLENGQMPILTTKKTAWKTCLKELLWFIKGQTSNHILNEQNVHIWDGNSSKEYLKSRGLSRYDEGDLGPIYGFQWRHYNGFYKNCNSDYTAVGIDQLQEVIDCLKDPNKRSSRRMIISAWNPCQIDEMALPPCHVLFQFNVINGNKLSCSMYQRSVDSFLGLSFNIASYSFLTHLLAKHCNLEAYEFIHYGGNVHIYDDHFEQVKEQLTRQPYKFPTVEILNKYDNINDYTVDDFKLNNYKHHPQIKGDMRV